MTAQAARLDIITALRVTGLSIPDLDATVGLSVRGNEVVVSGQNPSSTAWQAVSRLATLQNKRGYDEAVIVDGSSAFEAQAQSTQKSPKSPPSWQAMQSVQPRGNTIPQRPGLLKRLGQMVGVIRTSISTEHANLVDKASKSASPLGALPTSIRGRLHQLSSALMQEHRVPFGMRGARYVCRPDNGSPLGILAQDLRALVPSAEVVYAPDFMFVHPAFGGIKAAWDPTGLLFGGIPTLMLSHGAVGSGQVTHSEVHELAHAYLTSRRLLRRKGDPFSMQLTGCKNARTSIDNAGRKHGPVGSLAYPQALPSEEVLTFGRQMMFMWQTATLSTPTPARERALAQELSEHLNTYLEFLPAIAKRLEHMKVPQSPRVEWQDTKLASLQATLPVAVVPITRDLNAEVPLYEYATYAGQERKSPDPAKIHAAVEQQRSDLLGRVTNIRQLAVRLLGTPLTNETTTAWSPQFTAVLDELETALAFE